MLCPTYLFGTRSLTTASGSPYTTRTERPLKEGGSKGARLFRTADDPRELVVLLEWDDLAKARRFAASDDLREAMQRAGVADRPDLYFLDEVEKAPA